MAEASYHGGCPRPPTNTILILQRGLVVSTPDLASVHTYTKPTIHTQVHVVSMDCSSGRIRLHTPTSQRPTPSTAASPPLPNPTFARRSAMFCMFHRPYYGATFPSQLQATISDQQHILFSTQTFPVLEHPQTPLLPLPL